MKHMIRLLVATLNAVSSNSICINSWWGESIKVFSQTSSGAPVAGGLEQVFEKYWHIVLHQGIYRLDAQVDRSLI